MLCHVSHWSLSDLEGLTIAELNFWTAQAVGLWNALNSNS